ncbi:hypothetical protein HYDPIDRAFT_44557 [Hydnomerulius pinastri MD-312]|uniref:Uncharacterized protein n=1 Tax=Hydnomerulius pinastri MD-312 TaxID=994086 RepID=A0A0C9VY22_9AGAM|nr:hypothetical protein HYDPIDRAFT_44557 [Hydnomerulius pinastri MD-312]
MSSVMPMTPSGMPVPMTPGVAMTPGVTMTPGAFWPHAPWINPAVGAPVHVHADSHGGHNYPGGEGGYFPPVTQPPGGDTGYFPPVSGVVNEILKEGSGFGSDSPPDETVNGGSDGTESTSRGALTSMWPDPPRAGLVNGSQKGGAHVIKRTTSVQDGGLAKRGSLPHRESDPEVTTATNKGGASKEA